MKRKFITNLGFLLILNIAVKPVFVFGIDRVVQNKTGTEVYGNYFYLLNIALIFQILLDLGIENFIRKEISRNPKLMGYFIANMVFLKVLLGILYFAVCLFAAYAIGISKSAFPLFLFILLNQFMASFILFLRANFGGMQLFKTESIISVLDRMFMIFIVGYLLITPYFQPLFRIEWFVISQTAAYTLTILISILFIYRHVAASGFSLNLKQSLLILNQLKPYAVLVLLMVIYYRVDSLMLVRILPDGKAQAGIFAHSFRILDFISNYALLFPLLLLPIFSRIIHLGQKVNGLLRLSVLILIIPSYAILCPSVVYRFEIFTILYKEYITLSADSFAVLTISYAGMCISYTFGALLTANGNLRSLSIMAAIAVILSLTLNIILIPKYKVMGAAITNASVQLFTIVIHIILVKRIFRMQTNYLLIAKIVLYFILSAFFCFLLKNTGILWLTGFCISVFFSMILAFVLKLVNIRNVFTLFRGGEISSN